MYHMVLWDGQEVGKVNDETKNSKCRTVKEEVNAVTEPESNRKHKKK